MKLNPKLRRSFSAIHEFIRRLSGILDYLLWLLIDPAKFKFVNAEKINRILLVSLHDTTGGNVGTNFVVLGVLNYIKKVRPDLSISFLLDSKSLAMLGEVPGINIIKYKNQTTINEIKKRGYDMAYILNPGFHKVKDFLFIPIRVTLTSINIFNLFRKDWRFYTTRRIHLPRGMHMVDYYFKMFEDLGFRFDKHDIIFHFEDKESNKVKSFLRKNKIKKFIVMHPGSKYVVETFKRGKWPPYLWPVDRYAKVADYFIRKGFHVLVTGTLEEFYLFDEIKKCAKNKSKLISCCGVFTQREVGALLSKASALLSTDTSVVHIGYQVKVPLVELMGPSRPDIYGPWPITSAKNLVLFDNGPCAYMQRKIDCPDDRMCLGNIYPEDTIAALKDIIKKVKIPPKRIQIIYKNPK